MKKYWKVLIILFFMTGCSANYNIEIYNNEVREDFTIIENDVTKFDSKFSNDGNASNDNSESSSFATYYDVAKNDYNTKTFSIVENTNSYYKKKFIDESDKLGINYKYNFSINNYNDSFIVNNFYNYFTILNQKDTFVLTTSDSSNCFNMFPILDKLTVTIETNHKVKDNNADEVGNNTYTWNIDKNNASSKRIYIELYSNKYVFNYKGRLTKLLYIGIGLAFLLIIVIIFLKKKSSKNDRI